MEALSGTVGQRSLKFRRQLCWEVLEYSQKEGGATANFNAAVASVEVLMSEGMSALMFFCQRGEKVGAVANSQLKDKSSNGC